MEKIVGLIGCGRWGSAHLTTLLSMKEQGMISKVIVCDIDSLKLENLSPKIDGLYSDLFQMINQHRFDLITIATPPSSHVGIAIPLLQRGIKTLVEKPIGLCYNDAERLVDVSTASATSFYSGYLLRHHSGFQLVKNRIETHQTPPLKSLHFFRHSTRDPPHNEDVIRALASHAVDLLSFFDLHQSTPTISLLPQRNDSRATYQAQLNLHFPSLGVPVEVLISVGWGFEQAKSEARIVTDDTSYIIDFNIHDSILEYTESSQKTLAIGHSSTPLHMQYYSALFGSQPSNSNTNHLQTALLLEQICKQVHLSK